MAYFRGSLAGVALLAVGCSRSELASGSLQGSGGSVAACSVDADCVTDACTTASCVDGHCASAPLSCPDDGDGCTEDRCDPALGCVYSPLAFDRDGDGVRGPRTGFAPGAPGACGDDCDDANPLVYPGRAESGACDGVDNDCNGVVDDGARYAGGIAPVRVSSQEYLRASRGALIATPRYFVLTFTGLRQLPGATQRPLGLMQGLFTNGSLAFEAALTDRNVGSYAAALAWSGDSVLAAWSDARQAQNYEIYLNRFRADGVKLEPDQRVTFSDGFSVSPDVLWSGSEFLLAWQDRRREVAVTGDDSRIFGQRVRADGTLDGASQELVAEDPVAENAVLSRGKRRIGLAYTTLDAALNTQLGFRSFDFDFGARSSAVAPVGADVDSPGLYFVRDRFVALWSTHGASWGDSLWGATFSEDGRLLSPPRPVTSGARFARSHSAVSLGDRLLVVWGDDRSGNYDLSWQILGPDLNVLVPRQPLVVNAADSIGPVAAIASDGSVGVLFDDWSSGSEQVYFTTLSCVAGR